MLEVTVGWAEVKGFIDSGLPFRWVRANGAYRIYAFDDRDMVWVCVLPTDPSDAVTDFADNYSTRPKQAIAQEVIPRAPKNEYTMQPWGAKKGRFVSSDRACVVTLSNRSDDGLTFTYSMSMAPRVGDYIFQDNSCSRAWITAVDTDARTVTLDTETARPPLTNGPGIYSQGFWLGVDVPDWFNPMYLWGVVMNFRFSGSHDGRDDFIELSIVDTNDYFKSDDFCMAMLGASAADAAPIFITMGFEQNGEYGHWTKYYDESWVLNIDGKIVMTPDGAPGELMSHLETRVSMFTSRTDATLNEIFLDYLPTSKS